MCSWKTIVGWLFTGLLWMMVCYWESAAGQQTGNPMMDRQWDAFKIVHGKNYGPVTNEIRRKRWEKRLESIRQHNQQAALGLVSYRLKETRFTDYGTEELKHLTGLLIPPEAFLQPQTNKSLDLLDARALPTSIDLRKSPCMPPIKSQGSCGCCWAFGATTPLEYQHCMNTGQLKLLSEQQLVDCTYDDEYKNRGCIGGWYHYAWRYVKDFGLTLSSSYPYVASDENNCNYDPNDAVVTVVKYNTFSRIKSETLLKQMVATVGPVTVAICGLCPTFYNYADGIYDDPRCRTDCTIDHAAVVVGYGKTRAGVEYWIIRNSWGTHWGMDGYVFFKMGVNQNWITYMPSYPITE